MNNYVIIGIVAAVAISVGVVGVYAMSQTDLSIPSSQDARETVSDLKDDIEDIDPGYGQVTEKEGAYSP